MLDKILRFLIAAIMAFAGGALMQLASPVLMRFISTEILKMDMGIFKMTLATLVCVLIGAILGVIVGLLIAPYFITKLKRFSAWVEGQLNKMPIHDVIAGAVGLVIGLILAALLGSAFSHLPIVGNYIPIVFSIVFGYLGIVITMRKREDFVALFDFIPRLIRGSGAPDGSFSAGAESSCGCYSAGQRLQAFGHQRDYRRTHCGYHTDRLP